MGDRRLQPDPTDDRTVLGRIDPDEVDGVFAIMGDVTVEWGVLPPLVPAVVDEQLISAGTGSHPA